MPLLRAGTGGGRAAVTATATITGTAAASRKPPHAAALIKARAEVVSGCIKNGLGRGAAESSRAGGRKTAA